MVYRGHIQNGRVVLDDEVELPEGARVKVDVAQEEQAVSIVEEDVEADGSSFLDDLIGTAVDLPADAARNKNHYLYGQPKS